MLDAKTGVVMIKVTTIGHLRKPRDDDARLWSRVGVN